MPNWSITTPEMGLQPIETVSTTQQHPIGKEVSAKHATYGEARFKYLYGVASTVAGSVVIFNAALGTTTLAPATAGLGTPLAIAMAANVLSRWGWYCVNGTVPAAKVTTGATAAVFAPNVAIYLAGSGALSAAAASGKQVVGGRSANTATVLSATTTVLVTVNAPAAEPSNAI